MTILNGVDILYKIVSEEKNERISVATKLLAFYFVLMPLDSINFLGMGSLLKIVALFPIAAILILHRKTRLQLNVLVGWAILYTLTVAISCAYSINFSDSLSSTKRLLINMILILCVGGLYDEYNKTEYSYLIKALVLGGAANIILTFLNSDTSKYGRMTLSVAGSTQDLNYINGYMLFALAFFMKKLISDRKIYALAPIAVIFVFTLMTGSRGAFVALAAIVLSSMLYIFFVEKNIKPGTVFITVIVTVLVLMFYKDILMLISPQVAERFTLEYIRNYRGVNRTEIWAHILGVFKESSFFRQLFGYGTGTVPLVNTMTHQVAHNLWIDHLIANGIIGLMIFTGMQICFLKEAFRSKDVVLFSSYIGLLAMCLTLSLVSYKPIWNCMMMIMIAAQIRKKTGSFWLMNP